MLEPTSPGSLSTVTTCSSTTFSCLPPQRTIAYTRELSLSSRLYLALRPLRFLACHGTPVSRRRARLNVHTGPAQRATPDRQGYQTSAPARTGSGFRRRRSGLLVRLWLRLPRVLMPLGRPVCWRLLRCLRVCGDGGDHCRSARAQPGRLAPGHGLGCPRPGRLAGGRWPPGHPGRRRRPGRWRRPRRRRRAAGYRPGRRGPPPRPGWLWRRGRAPGRRCRRGLPRYGRHRRGHACGVRPGCRTPGQR